ncbi:MAG: AAA family ATPase [Kiritimatiellae bacterium]|jgi:DNA transposition AAA+ family ATPase|nr:AAA family ATPase [Kiritimatiellia bacterium]
MAQINITAETVKQGLDRILAAGIINQDGYDSITWYFNHCRSLEWDQQRATAEIKRSSWTTLYRVFQGTYEASYDSVIKAINRVKIITEQRAKLAAVDYIETSTWTTVRDVLDNALIGQEISTIDGNSQIGKTSAIEHYIAINPDKRIVYVRVPAAPNKSIFYEAFAKACFLSNNRNYNTMRNTIINHIDDRTLIIFDEAHQLFLGTDKTAVSIFEYIREVYDVTRCGVVLIGTNVLTEKLTKGASAKVYKQLVMRGVIHARLPDHTPRSDIRKAAANFGFKGAPTPDASKVIKDINESNGFGVMLKVFKASATMAKKQGNKPSWDHFVEAWVILQQLSRNNKGDQ